MQESGQRHIVLPKILMNLKMGYKLRSWFTVDPFTPKELDIL